MTFKVLRKTPFLYFLFYNQEKNDRKKKSEKKESFSRIVKKKLENPLKMIFQRESLENGFFEKFSTSDSLQGTKYKYSPPIHHFDFLSKANPNPANPQKKTLQSDIKS